MTDDRPTSQAERSARTADAGARAADGASSIPKLETGIPGFDHLTLGGLPRRRATVLAGQAGSAKTVFAGQFLAEGVRRGQPGVFVTLEEPAADLRLNLTTLGWDVAGWEASGDWRFVDASPLVREDGTPAPYSFETLLAQVGQAVDATGAERLVLDSLNTVFLLSQDPGIARQRLRDLVSRLRAMGLTVLLTVETAMDPSGSLSRYGIEEFVADNVVLLRNTREGKGRRRTVEVLKMRGSTHRKGDYAFTIQPGIGLVVLPVSAAVLQSSPTSERVPTGVPAVDDLLHGGLFRDSITLLGGPTGTGKTLFSVEFLASAAARGERCLLLAYEESPDQIARNAVGAGRDLPRLVEERLAADRLDLPGGVLAGGPPAGDQGAGRHVPAGQGRRRLPDRAGAGRQPGGVPGVRRGADRVPQDRGGDDGADGLDAVAVHLELGDRGARVDAGRRAAAAPLRRAAGRDPAGPDRAEDARQRPRPARPRAAGHRRGPHARRAAAPGLRRPDRRTRVAVLDGPVGACHRAPVADPLSGPAGVFDRVADTYDAVGVPWFGPIADGLVRELAVQPGERVLDVGCGRGAALVPLARATGPGGRALGVDLAPGMVQRTAADVADLPWVEVRVADAGALDLPPASFDVVASSLVLFFLPDPVAAVRDWAGLLVPGGRLGVTTFGPQDERWREIDALFLPFLPAALLDARTSGRAGPFGSDAGMEELVAGAGLVDVRTAHGTVSVTFRDPEQWLAFSWSHGQRAMWEAVPAERRDEVRDGAYAVLARGATFTQEVRYTLAVGHESGRPPRGRAAGGRTG